MTKAQFSEFMEVILSPYVAERAAADHVSTDVAERYARDQHARLLADGHLTAGHRFLRIVSTNNNQPVGGVWLWIDVGNKQAFLYNITVFPQYRRRGFASDALALVEQTVSRSRVRYPWPKRVFVKFRSARPLSQGGLQRCIKLL
jgi:ribosomal protein S18 acetylase RimI-like enzyme